MRLIFLMVIVFAMNFPIQASENPSSVIYSKTLSDGRLVIASKSVTNLHIVSSQQEWQEEQRKADERAEKGGYAKSPLLLGGDFRLQKCWLSIHAPNASEEVFWRREVAEPVFRGSALSRELTIRDVVTDDGRIAVLYSCGSVVSVDVVEKVPAQTNSVIKTFDLGRSGMVKGQLSWAGDLYVKIDALTGPEVWRIGKDGLSKVSKSDRSVPVGVSPK